MRPIYTMDGSRWHAIDADEALRLLKTSATGLAQQQAEQLLLQYGGNELQQEKRASKLEIFANQFKNFLVVLLVIATAFSFLIGEVLDAVVIIAIVILNAIFGFLQEYRAERALQALQKLSAPEAVVLRNGKEQRIASRLLVPGDIVILEEGSKVPADLRLIEAVNLKVDESALTGESVPVKKTTEPCQSGQIADMACLAFSSTVVTYGRGKGAVIATGMQTEIGKIAHLVQQTSDQQTPLQAKLEAFGKRLGLIVMAIAAVVIAIGLLRGYALDDMIRTGIALAIAAVPEGLAAVVTVTLAIGLQKLVKKDALMRKLPAVETLGSTTVICSDKTGTLTKNEMTVKQAWVLGKLFAVDGDGYAAKGKFLSGGQELRVQSEPALSLALLAGALCNNARLNGNEVYGDPTEAALLVAAQKGNASVAGWERVHEVPFSSERKMMTVLCQKDGAKAFAKGATEKILERCTHVMEGNKKVRLRPEHGKSIEQASLAMGNQALRVLALAYREASPAEAKDEQKLESGLTFLGLAGMLDPPRETVKDDIQKCHTAGIKVVMITGDHLSTALAIAKDIGIMAKDDHKSLTGADLERMAEKELEDVVEQVVVYARVNPEHKMKIVNAFKQKGHVVAMTGDGVNDAPALKKADIGIAMGIKGTDVAKEASDMVLTDDNFSSIVDAIEEGRGIFDNIRNFIQYLLSSNLGEVMIVFFAILLGLSGPSGPILTAIMLLWINLLTDGLPALALGVDPPSKHVMERKPLDPKHAILDKAMVEDMLVVAVIMTVGTLSIFVINLHEGAIKAQTAAFTAIVVFEMARVQSVRLKSKLGIFSNMKLVYAMAASIFLQLLVIYIPWLSQAFGTVPLSALDWLEIVGMAILLVLAMYAKHKLLDR